MSSLPVSLSTTITWGSAKLWPCTQFELNRKGRAEVCGLALERVSESKVECKCMCKCMRLKREGMSRLCAAPAAKTETMGIAASASATTQHASLPQLT